jgi:hypothetical protein
MSRAHLARVWRFFLQKYAEAGSNGERHGQRQSAVFERKECGATYAGQGEIGRPAVVNCAANEQQHPRRGGKEEQFAAIVKEQVVVEKTPRGEERSSQKRWQGAENFCEIEAPPAQACQQAEPHAEGYGVANVEG